MAAKPLKASYILLTFIFPFLTLASTNDGIQFIYSGFQDANLLLKGIAAIHSDGLLQLTNDTEQKSGYAFHPKPVNFTTSRTFSTSFVVAIHPNIPDHGAQGMTFLISPSTNFDNALPDEFLGLVNSSTNGLASTHIFAIELDTVQNAHFGDIDSNHVGIDVNSLRSIDAAFAAYFSAKESRNRSFLLTDSKAMQLWVEYDEVEMIVNVTIAPIKVSKPSQSLLSAKVNLSEVLLDTMYIGFSASTGLTSNDHYVLGWSWNQNGQAQGLDALMLPSLPNFDTANRRPGKVFLALLISVMFLLVVISASTYAIHRTKYEEVKEDWEKEYAAHRFSYKDLYKLTKGFKITGLLGEGGHVKVYKGVLRNLNNLEVAIKKIPHESREGMKEFVGEIVSMRRLRHRNLVQLLGYCRRKGELLLVYDYMPNGSLDKFLYGDEKPTLFWHHRFKIIREVAFALLYLHEEWEQVVLHRDVKASNIMKLSVLAKVKQKARKWRQNLGKKKPGQDGDAAPSWGVAFEDYEKDEDPRRVGTPNKLFTLRRFSNSYKEGMRQRSMPGLSITEKHILSCSVGRGFNEQCERLTQKESDMSPNKRPVLEETTLKEQEDSPRCEDVTTQEAREKHMTLKEENSLAFETQETDQEATVLPLPCGETIEEAKELSQICMKLIQEEQGKTPTPTPEEGAFEQEKQETNSPIEMKSLAYAVTEKLKLDCTSNSEETQMINSYEDQVTTREEGCASVADESDQEEHEENGISGERKWDKGVSVTEYIKNKLEPGEDERALSQVISEAISPRRTPGDKGVMEKVKEVVTLLLLAEQQQIEREHEQKQQQQQQQQKQQLQQQKLMRHSSSSMQIPVSTNAYEEELNVEEESNGRILQVN